MKIYVIINVANEIDGRLTAVKIEKAYKDKASAEKFMASNKTSYLEDLQVDSQKLKMLCERNVQEVDVED
jgi:hypothetical protein